jgi:hypothetical protein
VYKGTNGALKIDASRHVSNPDMPKKIQIVLESNVWEQHMETVVCMCKLDSACCACVTVFHNDDELVHGRSW